MKKKNILLINNYTHFIKDLEKALGAHNVTTVGFDKVQPKDAEDFDCIVLSGGGEKGEVSDSKTLYKNEIEIVRQSNKPIFGICEGLQVIGAAFDSVFHNLPMYRRGVNQINIVGKDPIFKDIQRFELLALEYHHIAIKHAGEDLKVLAVSPDGIEVIRHTSQLIYGTQFHPEELEEGNNGHTLLQSFLKMVG